MLEKPNSKSNLTNPLLSVIIPCYTMDRLNDVINLIFSIKAQTYSNIEIIIVSDSSHLYDELSSRLMKSDYSPIQLVYNEGAKGTSSAKNLGITYAKSDIISFVDDDVILHPSWAEQIIKTFEEDASIIGVTGPALPMWEGEPVTWFPDEFSWILGYTSWVEWPQIKDVESVWGMNATFRREAFRLAGKFRTDLGPKGDFRSVWWKRLGSEENELSLRIRRKTRKRIVYNPQVVVKHKVFKDRLFIQYIAKRAFHVGRNRGSLRRSNIGNNQCTASTELEHLLSKRILRELLPSTLRYLLKNPRLAWRRFSITIVVLCSAILGYLSADTLRTST